MGHYVKFPDWSLPSATKGEYQKGSRVYYEPLAPIGEHQPTGFGFVANSLIHDNAYKTLPPLSGVGGYLSPAWDYHPYYAPLWDSSRKYQENDRVFFIVTKEDPKLANTPNEAFIYKASLRYTGGSQPPNKELDSDGVRTWELVTVPLDSSDLKDTRPFLFPVKKKRGIWQNPDTLVNRDNRFQTPVYHPEEGAYGEWIEPPPYDEHDDPIPRYPKEYAKWHTSVLQASPYDANVYTRLKIVQDDAGGLVSMKLGDTIHFAKYIHDYGPLQWGSYFQQMPADEKAYYLSADRQAVYTLYPYGSVGYWELYKNATGFSIEMWGTLENDDFEFINHIIKPVLNNSNNGYGPTFYAPPDIGVAMSNYNYVIVNGDLKDGDGNIITPQTPIEQCKRTIYISFNNVSFHNRKVTINFAVISDSYYWEKFYYYNIDGSPFLDGNGNHYWTWVQKQNKQNIFTMQRVYYTSGSVYSNGEFEIAGGDSSMDFSFLKSENTTVQAYIIGFKYE